MLSRSRLWALAALLYLLMPSAILGQQFLEQSINLGVAHTPQSFNLFGAGCSMVDFNLDGTDDLTYLRHQQLPSFFTSTATGFSGIASFVSASSSPKAIQWVDIDNDGDLDCFVTRRTEAIDLYERTGPFTFINRINNSGIINDNHHSYGASWGDYDLDGDLDLYLCAYDGSMNFSNQEDNNHLYRNNGNFQFEEVTTVAGLEAEYALSFQSLWLDINHDLYPDLFVINDKNMPNKFYLNNTDGTFTDISESSGMDVVMDAMTISCADFNQDAYLDIYITNSNVTFNASLGTLLFVGGPDNTFTEASEAYGLKLLNTFTWGANWMDIDNDGDLDLYVAEAQPLNPNLDDHLFVNQGAESGFQFIENNALLEGFLPVDSHGISSGDPNNDGYVDFCVTTNQGDPFRYFVNQGGDNNFLKVNLSGILSNTMGVGSWISAYAEGQAQTQYTFCGENYLGQNSYTKIFGLGSAEIVDSLIVEWPSGVVDRWYDIDINQTLTLSEGETFEIPFLEGEAFYNLCVGDSLSLSFNHPNFVSWSDGTLESQISITETGTYWANFTNAVNEELPSNSISVAFHEVEVPEFSVENISCFGGADGSVQVNLLEGQSLIYQNEMIEGELISNLAAGEVVYEVVDSIGCLQAVALELTEATEITSTGPIFIPNCEGGYELLFEGLHNGGTGELTVNWGEFNPDNVAPGAYNYYIIDDLACASTFGLELEAYDVLSVSGTISGVNDDGLGSIVLDVQGGFEPYDFEWTNTEGDTSAGDLEEGVYSVVVTDANGCESSAEFLITQISERGDEAIHLYPNPGTNGFVINNAAHARLRVRDAQGRMIFETIILDKAVFIETNHWAQGIYFLELAGEQVHINKQWIKTVSN